MAVRALIFRRFHVKQPFDELCELTHKINDIKRCIELFEKYKDFASPVTEIVREFEYLQTQRDKLLKSCLAK
jgi:hypothetical protein